MPRVHTRAERVGNREELTTDTSVTIEDIIGSRIAIDEETGCWNYTGSISGAGYGMYGHKPVHRIVYEIFNGPVPGLWHVHHECRNKRCCRPSHLNAMRDSDHLSLHARERRDAEA